MNMDHLLYAARIMEGVRDYTDQADTISFDALAKELQGKEELAAFVSSYTKDFCNAAYHYIDKDQAGLSDVARDFGYWLAASIAAPAQQHVFPFPEKAKVKLAELMAAFFTR